MKKHSISRQLISFFLATILTLTPLSSFASILGTAKIRGYTVQIGKGTYYTHNVFYSDQKGVGPQSENYITYTPNTEVTPIITAGEYLYGASTISNEASRLKAAGIDILGGANADFFSLQTGVPMSNAIVDGKILTKDATAQDCIGFMEDGSAFMSKATFYSDFVLENGTKAIVYCINKYRQPYSIYMMTSDFSTHTHNSTPGIDVVLGSLEGEMKLGTKMTAVVEAVNKTSSSAPIPKGKIILTVDNKAPKEFYEPMSALKVGDKLTLSFGVIGDARWNEVKLGMGSIGDKLLTNGEVNPKLGTGAAPRTAIGIKEDGSIIIYTIDGRQNGHSYGVQLKTLANRMKELGCIDALNLDGGGSTSITCRFPGDHDTATVNKPSDGSERRVSTFLFFRNNGAKTDTPGLLHLYPKMNYVLTGATHQLTVKATDSAFHPTATPENIQFRVEAGKNSTISDTGLFTAADNGIVNVYAEAGDAKGGVYITCLDSPTNVQFINKQTGKALTSATLNINDTLTLNAEAYGGYNKLVSQQSCFKWSADSSIGTFNNNTFTATGLPGTSGKIYVTAGKKTFELPVKIADLDKNSPDAYPQITMSVSNNRLQGKIGGKYKIPVEKKAVVLTCDGKPLDFEFNADTQEFTAALGSSANKITVFVTNKLGCTAFSTINASDKVKYTNPFSDTKGHWAEDVLNYMYDKKIINGEVIGNVLRFNPQKEMTRSEFAVMISNYLGYKAEDYKNVKLPYTDINAIPAWALNSFKALYANDILKGRYVSKSESCADPLTPITRAEAATVVARILPDGFLKAEIKAPDKKDIPDWALSGFSVLIRTGAMRGYEDGTLLPMRKLTKAEAAKILYSII